MLGAWVGGGDMAGEREIIFEFHRVGGSIKVTAVDAKTGAGIALRIDIDDEHTLAYCRQGSCQIDRGRGFSDPALLIGNGYNAWSGHGSVPGVHLVLPVCTSDRAQIPQFKNDAVDIDPAAMFYQIERPSVSAFFDFCTVIPSFVKERHSA